MSSTKKTLLVVGGGVGGVFAITGLRQAEKKSKTPTEIIMVEPKAYCEIAWGSYRMPFDASVADDCLLDLAVFCKQYVVERKATTVTNLTLTEATLADNSTVKFDICLIAVGATTPWPALGRGVPTQHDGSRAARMQELKEEGQRLVEAKSVVVIGGGLVGTELAGDLAYYRSEKQKDATPVTLIHSQDHLCPELSPSAAKMVQQKLTKLGVKVILNDKAEEVDGKLVLKSTGEALEADQVVWTVGLSAINSFLDASLKEAALNEKGWITTDESCRVAGTNGRLLAFGDCSTHLPNSASHLKANIPKIGRNLYASLYDSEPKLQTVAPASPSMVCCTVGPKDGVLAGSWFHTQYLVPAYKNSTMFVPIFKGAIGYK